MLNKGKWTGREVRKLYQYAEQMSQAEAAKRLNRSIHSISAKASKLGIVWFQGFFNSQDIAALAGCSRKQASRAIKGYYPKGTPCTGSGKSLKIRIPFEDVDGIVKEIKKKHQGGRWNLAEIARVVGCSANTVRRLVRILYHDKEMFHFFGKNRVYYIEDKDAKRLMKVLRGTRPQRRHNILGGRNSH